MTAIFGHLKWCRRILLNPIQWIIVASLSLLLTSCEDNDGSGVPDIDPSGSYSLVGLGVSGGSLDGKRSTGGSASIDANWNASGSVSFSVDSGVTYSTGSGPYTITSKVPATKRFSFSHNIRDSGKNVSYSNGRLSYSIEYDGSTWSYAWQR